MARIPLLIVGITSLLLALGSALPSGVFLPTYNHNYGIVGGGDYGPPFLNYAVGQGYPEYPIGFGGFGYDRSYAVRTQVPGGVYGFDGCGCDGYGKYGCNC